MKRRTRRDRLRTKLAKIKEALRRCMHRPIPQQGAWLTQVLDGYFNYHAVPTNGRVLGAFRRHVAELWQRTLRRRSQKDRTAWDRMKQLADTFLPLPTIRHPWPHQRFAVRHPRREPGAGKPHAGICAGGAQK